MVGSLAHGIPPGRAALYIAGVGEVFGEEAVKRNPKQKCAKRINRPTKKKGECT